ncbi:MAG: carboxypeptidase-like regulatory domain-containing protein [Acidobacteriota bacterium]|nr:carboxypeptidase-like regulatory domain-containing protein [Acidobacteriota bacterium]
MRKIHLMIVPALIAATLAAFPCVAAAQETGLLRGRVLDAADRPAAGLTVILASRTHILRFQTESDPSGRFTWAGLPSGAYHISVQTPGGTLTAAQPLDIEAPEAVFAVLRLSPDADNPTAAALEPAFPGFSDFSSATFTHASQIHNLPTGNTVWNIIENQDFSATTNRIDVGGLWNTTPAVFSPRGAVSWTQVAYRLNGMDVTDPYFGGMPLFHPDVWSLSSMRLENGAFPAGSFSPGGSLDIATFEGSDDFRGGVTSFYLDRSYTTTNITPALQEEGLFATHAFRGLFEGNLRLSGPLVPGKVHFASSFSARRIARNTAEFEGDEEDRVLSGLTSISWLRDRSRWKFLWTGQTVDRSAFGAGRRIPSTSTLDRKDYHNIFQILGTLQLEDNHVLKAGLSYARTDIHAGFQEGAEGPHGLEIFRTPLFGPAARSYRDGRDNLSFLLKGEWASAGGDNSLNRLIYGVRFRAAASSSRKDIRENHHLRFFEGRPLEVAFFDGPFNHRESSLETGVFASNTWTLDRFLSLHAAFHLDWTQGRIPGSSGDAPSIDWIHLSSRLGASLPLSANGRSQLRIHLGRYFYSLPLSFLTWGNPGAPGSRIYAWNDSDGDGRFSAGESGTLLRREGPLFAAIDPELKRPRVDELSIGFMRRSLTGWHISVTGFLRETRNLPAALNIGVPFSAYDPHTLYDIGDDRIPGSHDDLIFTVYERRPEYLGRDFFLLTANLPDKRGSSYQGLDVAFYKRTSDKLFIYMTFTATQAAGESNPGNTEWENDDGIAGTLYSDPNSLINARGRLRFDRAYTARIGFQLDLPWNIRLGSVTKYYDGQPFARWIVVSGMNQGPYIIQAHPRGKARYEFNMNVDLRLEKIFDLGGSRLRIILDGFNLTNFNLATEESPWTGDAFPLRYATEIQPPRVVRLGLSYEF